MITGVLTSCGRHDLLETTLESFFAVCPAGLDRFIIVEDGPSVPDDTRSRFADQDIEWISTAQRVGQIAAIDYAYSRVTTPYIFHMEDDWVFYRPGFLDKSLAVLRSNPKCLQVQLRPPGDINGHPLDPYMYASEGVKWRRLAFSYLGDWHGFSFNPGLRRLSDYVSVGGYGIHTKFDLQIPWQAEVDIGILYRRRDFFTAVLADDELGYVRHTGDGRHVGGEGTP